MWLLSILSDVVSAKRALFLVGGNSYTVGRRDAQIVTGENDPSVSRNHATLVVMPCTSRHMSAGEGVDSPEVVVLDTSKHGTFVNNELICRITRKATLSEGDVLRFGSHTTATLTWLPVIAAISPHLSDSDTKSTMRIMSKIGGLVTNARFAQCPSVGDLHAKHAAVESPVDIGPAIITPQEVHRAGLRPAAFVFVTNALALGEPVCMMAMMHGYTPVRLDFLFTLFEALLSDPTVPVHRWPQPTPFDPLALVDRPMFRYPLYQIDERHFLAFTPSATFRTVHFVFLEHALFDRFAAVIEAGGGKASTVAPDAVMDHFAVSRGRMPDESSAVVSRVQMSNTRRTKRSQETLRLLGLVDDPADAHGANLRVVLSASVFEHITGLFRGGEASALRNPGVRDAALHFFDAGYLLLHEDNIHSCIYTHDTASQLLPTSPGVLCRAEMVDAANATDSDETVPDEDPYQFHASELLYQRPAVSPCLAQQISRPVCLGKK